MRRIGFGAAAALVVACAGSGCTGTSDDAAGFSPTDGAVGGSGGQAAAGASGRAGHGGLVGVGGGGPIGGSSSLGGGGSSGGRTSTSAGGAGGGISSTGGTPSTGGVSSSGGQPSNGGTPATGGVSSTGGTPSTGGKSGAGGASSTGGNPGTGGKPGTGGVTGSGGTLNTGGGVGTGGATTGEPPELAGILAAHNAVRAAKGLQPLTWDPALATIAHNWVIQCVDTAAPIGLVDHNAGRSSTYPEYVGENIYASSGTATGAAAVNSWKGEEANYNYAANTCSSTCGHYTQLVWATTTKVGCALYKCTGLTYSSTIVCDYAPGGNINGQRPY
jgi:hypothetical protein